MTTIDDTESVELLREMIRARHCSRRLFNLQRQGRIGTFAPIDGQEAAVVGSAAALDPATDWVLPQYREPIGLGRFGPAVLESFMLTLRGHPRGGYLPSDCRCAPIQISIAAQLPHAVGLAWGRELRGEPGVVCAYFGDGASSEGDFYEAANFAAVLNVPVIFFCTNNGWAISTPRTVQTAASSIAAKAAAFGMPGVQVDGNDVLAVRDATAAARDRALAGGGPTLIEAVTYRMGPHTTADDPTRYVPGADLEEWAQRDPITRLAAALTAAGAWDDGQHGVVERAADAAFDAILERVEAAALDPDEMFDHLYASPPDRHLRQRQAMRHDLATEPG